MVSCSGSLVQSCRGEGGALQTNVTGLCGEDLQCSDHTVCPRSRHVLSPSTLLRLQAALQGAGPELRALPRLKPLRFRVSVIPQTRGLGWACADSVGPAFCAFPARAAQATRSFPGALSLGAAHLPVRTSVSGRAGPVRLCLYAAAGLWLPPSRRTATIQNLRRSLVRNWEPVCSLVGVPSLGPSWPLSPPGCLLPPAGDDGPVGCWVALLWNCSVVPLFCKGPAVPSVRALPRLILSLVIPQFKLLSHISSFRLPSGHSGLVLTLSNATGSSPFRSHFLVADASIWATFLLGVAFRPVICGFLFIFPPS